jgi:hypothetical protein
VASPVLRHSTRVGQHALDVSKQLRGWLLTGGSQNGCNDGRVYVITTLLEEMTGIDGRIAVGLIIGFIFGATNIIRYGPGPNGMMRTLGQYMLGSAATFG